jgi:hypothetical protein
MGLCSGNDRTDNECEAVGGMGIGSKNWIKSSKTKLRGLSPRMNYIDWATAACRRSYCQLLRVEGTTWSAWRIPYDRILRF